MPEIIPQFLKEMLVNQYGQETTEKIIKGYVKKVVTIRVNTIKTDKQEIIDSYANIIRINKEKVNENADNIEKIAITDKYTVASKVKEILKQLVNKPKFVFNKVFSLQRCEKEELVTAFSGLLELSRRNKVITEQEKLFGDISVEKNNHKII